MLLLVLVTQVQRLPKWGPNPSEIQGIPTYWFQMNAEKTESSLYLGIPGKKEESRLIRSFEITIEENKENIPSRGQLSPHKKSGFSIVIAKSPVQTYSLTQNCFLRIDEGEASATPVDSQTPIPTAIQPLGSCVSFSTEDATLLDNLIFPDAGEIRFYGESS